MPYADKKQKWLREKHRRDTDPEFAVRLRARNRAGMKRHRSAHPEKKWTGKGLPVPTRPQPDSCELCGRSGKLVNDHCHQTGRFRGWLCNRCNVALGWLGDSLEKLTRVTDYLRRHD